MTFDGGVWHSEISLSSGEASHIYAALCRGELPGRGVTPSPAVDAFYEELTSDWPEIGPICKLNRSNAAVVFSCDWSKAKEVHLLFQHLAQKHGLIYFDPQSEEVYLPEYLQGDERPS
ncbi:MAG: hypothetical protein JOZ45_14470 [Acidobacteriaceae bacterium]|nr:hypothetical protein [Acidobacteriaceae bacterium]